MTERNFPMKVAFKDTETLSEICSVLTIKKLD